MTYQPKFQWPTEILKTKDGREIKTRRNIDEPAGTLRKLSEIVVKGTVEDNALKAVN